MFINKNVYVHPLGTAILSPFCHPLFPRDLSNMVRTTPLPTPLSPILQTLLPISACHLLPFEDFAAVPCSWSGAFPCSTPPCSLLSEFHPAYGLGVPMTHLTTIWPSEPKGHIKRHKPHSNSRSPSLIKTHIMQNEN